jgi:hypothetical protein
MAAVLENDRLFSCNIPVDADYFDVSGFVGTSDLTINDNENENNIFKFFDLDAPEGLPSRGQERVLASYQLHPQYCGVLTHFAQFTDLNAKDNSQILTPGFEWIISQNGKPLFPYMRLEMVINPWGCNCLPVLVKLDENARIEIAIRNRSIFDLDLYPIKAFAGRIMGRYWYNSSFGGR